jgi:LacI family transcriptional regulator
MNRNWAASQNDIAKASGFSRSTVSRALDNHRGIPESTKQKIFDIAKKLGYKKNPIVSMLTAQVRASRTRKVNSTLAYITTLSTPALFLGINPTYSRFFLGAQKRAEELGYGLDPIWRRDSTMTAERITKILISRGISGLLLAPRPNPLSHISLRWEKFAAVAIGHPLPSPKVHFAGAWHYNIMSAALRVIHKYGYRRVGFAVLPESDQYSNYALFSRYLLYRSSLPTKYQVPLLYKPSQAEEIDLPRFEQWFSRHQPEVILCLGPQIPEWLSRLGLSVPQDVAYADLCLGSVDGTFAGVSEMPEVIAAGAVDLVVEQLHLNNFGPPEHPKTLLIEGKWVDGKTLPRKHPAASS